jgi:beta-mannosidase
MTLAPTQANITCPGRVYVRQAASSWGWDWAKRYSPQGLWRPVYIAFLPHPPNATVTTLAAIVRPAEGEPANTTRFTVDVRLTVHAAGRMTAALEVSGDWGGGTRSLSIVRPLIAGSNDVRVQLSAEDVELWYPHGYGAQPRYNLTASMPGSSMRRLVGFRTVRLQTDGGGAKQGESTGSGNSSMVLVVNGQPIFVRGSSLVPLDTFNGRTSGTATMRMLRSTVAAQMCGARLLAGGWG